jgi:replicative DNA helicase
MHNDLKVPPQNLEAEESVLGGILIENDAMNSVLDILIPEDFYKEANRKIFHCAINLFEKSEPVDLITLTNELSKNNILEEVGGATYLASLVDKVPTAANIQNYARIVREKSILRDIIRASTDIISESYNEGEDIEDFLDRTEKIIFGISERMGRSALYPIRTVIKDSFKTIERLYEKKEMIAGLPTGFKDIDKITSGLQPSDLIVVAGRPSMGKTSFCLNIASHVALKMKTAVAVFSLEMSKEQLVTRMLCSESKVDSSLLRGGAGEIKEEDWYRLTRAAGELSEAPIFIDDSPQITTLEMRAKARRLKMSQNLGLVMVDYLQLMQNRGKYESREREISDISRSLKALAKELNVPVIALSQLNRGVESRNDKRPQMSDLRESGAIEQDADLIAFIYRDELYNKDTEEKGIAEIIVAKHRNGPTGVAKLAFIAPFTKFENLAFEYSA